MAVNYISIGASPLGQALIQGLRNITVGRDQLVHIRAIMIQAIDGNDYSTLEQAFGIPLGKGAAMFAELDSFISKLTTNADVTNVQAAWDQINAKFGAF